MRVFKEPPKPDITSFVQGIKNQTPFTRVHFVELFLDQEVMEYISENHLGGKWVKPRADDIQSQEAYWDNHIEVWYRLGYDYIRMNPLGEADGLRFPNKRHKTADTAQLSRQERSWTEQDTGLISSWEEFDAYPWPRTDRLNLEVFEYVAEQIPEGMGIFICPASGILEISMHDLLGYKNLCYLMYDNPELVKAVFDRVGEILLSWYRQLIGLDNLVGFFQGDDMGFKTATMLPPDFLREHVLPHHKRLADLAHSHNLLYFLHACGNLDAIMPDLINDVGIDGKHSFEDEIEPVTVFQQKYGDKVTPLGGIDVDRLCRASEADIREHVAAVLDTCMPRGPYALGSGNTVTNYVRVENYLAMLDEGLAWGNR